MKNILKVALVTILASTVMAERIDQSVSIKGVIESSGCEIKGIQYTPLNKPVETGNLQYIGDFELQAKCYGENSIKMYPVADDTELAVSFFGATDNVQYSESQPITFDGDFDSAVSVGVYILLEEGEYSATVRWIIES